MTRLEIVSGITCSFESKTEAHCLYSIQFTIPLAMARPLLTHLPHHFTITFPLLFQTYQRAFCRACCTAVTNAVCQYYQVGHVCTLEDVHWSPYARQGSQ